MSILNDIKKLVRSRSLDYVVNSKSGIISDKLCTYKWRGHSIHYRPGKSEAGLIYDALIRRKVILRPGKFFFKERVHEYWVPNEVDPVTILDIGGNIGVASIYYADLFPNAMIHSFEPVPTNFEMLLKNTTELPNVTAYNVALGRENKTTDIYLCDDNDNTGGFSLYDLDVDKAKKVEVELKNAKAFLSSSGISHADLIKIDTEGAEYDIITAMDPDFVSDVKWIIGELHGNQDFELLAYLSKWFEIGLTKSVRSRLFNFYARNKTCKDQIPWKW